MLAKEELARYLGERAKGQGPKKLHPDHEDALSEARTICADLKHQAQSAMQLLGHLRMDSSHDEVAVAPIGRSKWAELLDIDDLEEYEECEDVEEDSNSPSGLMLVADRAAKRIEGRAPPSCLRTKMSSTYDHIQSKVSCGSPKIASGQPLHGRRSVPTSPCHSAPTNALHDHQHLATKGQHSLLTVQVPGAGTTGSRPGKSSASAQISEPMVKLNPQSPSKPSRRRASMEVLDDAAMSAAKLLQMPSRPRRSMLEPVTAAELMEAYASTHTKPEPESPKKISWSSLGHSALVPAKPLMQASGSSGSIGSILGDARVPVAGRRAGKPSQGI